MTTFSFFSRVLDDASPAERYRLLGEQIRHAERWGFQRAWLAQHHFRASEGGLPSPFVFLAHIAASTTRIRLGTGIITLTLENAVRAAEDAVVADILSGHRLDLGLGSGGTPSSFAPFGVDAAEKSAFYARQLETFTTALAGGDLGGGNTLYPGAADLADRVWHATFSVDGGRRAGTVRAGLLLSRTQPRSDDRPDAVLADLQMPIVEAYRSALGERTAPRVTASRTVFVADDRAEALRFAEVGLRRSARALQLGGSLSLDELIARTDTHLGTPDDVAASLDADRTLNEADEVAIQVHSVDAPHPHILRSLELFATDVAPQLGYEPSAAIPEPVTTLKEHND